MRRLITYDKKRKRYFHKFTTDGFDTMFQKLCEKLFSIEDLMEKYNINDLTELEIALDYYEHRYDNVQTRRLDK